MRKPTKDQKQHQAQAACRAVAAICEAWTDALAAAQSRGYPRQSPGPRAAAATVRPDPEDPLHVHQMPPATPRLSASGDATGNAALVPDVAEKWVKDVKGILGIVIRASGEGPDRAKWTGPFHPPSLVPALRVCIADLVGWWPLGTDRILRRLHELANTARREWPPTPKPGQVVGEVKVHERANTAELCSEPTCGKLVAGTAEDPIRRIDGLPYHMRPCWETARKRKQRAGVA